MLPPFTFIHTSVSSPPDTPPISKPSTMTTPPHQLEHAGVTFVIACRLNDLPYQVHVCMHVCMCVWEGGKEKGRKQTR